MEQLSSIDASFIQVENPNLPMHISTLSIYDPSTAPGGKVRFKDIMDRYRDAVHEVPLLRRCLVEVPGNMDFPYWREAPDVDIEFHVRHVALPKPGDWRQFHIQVARIHSRPLDLQRPLWEVYVIEGLNHLEGIPSGSFAVMQKLHHAAMDGASVQKMFMALNAPTPEASMNREGVPTPLIQERVPQGMSLLVKASRRSAARPGKLFRAVGKTIRGMRDIKAAEQRGEIDQPVEPPTTRFSGPTSPHRVVTTTEFDLDEIKHLRHAVPGATLNDVALSVCGGALRHYLLDKSEPVDQALVAQIPVDIRDASQRDSDGNQIATINASSGSDIEDPVQRLEAVSRSTRGGKHRLQVMGGNLAMEMADAMGPHVTKAIFNVANNAPNMGALGELLPSGPNFILSNMPGPPVPVYLCGAQLQWGTGLGPMLPTGGMFITVTSTLGRFIYGISADRAMLPDPQFFAECLRRAYEEMRRALKPLADQNAPEKVGPKPGKKRTPASSRKSATKKRAPRSRARN